MARRRRRTLKRSCKGCGAEVSSTGPGRPREWCDTCTPAKVRDGRAFRGRTALARELLLRFGTFHQEPGRAALQDAVMRAARARGRDPTVHALLDVAAAAFAWAERLSMTDGDEQAYAELALPYVPIDRS